MTLLQTHRSVNRTPVTSSGSGKKILRVNGQIEAYGQLRLDGTQSADSQMEIQLVGADTRSLSLVKGGGLVMSGFPDLPENRKNVALRCLAVTSDEAHTPLFSPLEAGTGTTLEIKNALLENFTITCIGINNTGLRPNERLNFHDSRFVNSNLILNTCDTPRIAGNVFTSPPTPPQPAISLTQSPLAEIRDNQISGYPDGIYNHAADVMISDNVIDKCAKGILCISNQNVMIKGGRITDCGIGIDLQGSSGLIEEVKIVNCPVGIFAVRGGGFQANNVAFTLPAEGDNWAVSVSGGSGMLLNCNVPASQVKTEGPYTGDPGPVVTAFQYVVAKVIGTLPANAEIRLQTVDAKIKPGAADPNVRNSQALLRADGLSALPFTQQALIAKTWTIERDGKTLLAPPYKLSLVIPSGPDGEVKEVKSITIKPEDSWYRPEVNSEKPTVELTH